MAEHYRFFNYEEPDYQEYTADEFAEYFSKFLSDGLYTENGEAGLRVSAESGLNININTGYAFVKGYMYHNDMPMTKTLDNSDSMLDRIDRIVLRFDEIAREITVQVKKGTFSSTPQPPQIEVTDTVKEMTLAQVRIKKGSTNISANDIIDERFKDTCGLVSSLIGIPAGEMWNVWNNTLNNIETEWTNKQVNVQSEWNNIKANWENWFNSKQDMVGGLIFSGTVEPTEAVAGDYWFREVD
ncbi:hypothetical protein [Gudongella sp. SC589]|uniref:hypothetical protein n=1 Tax=Gudongella sp. SC589 TaxID=3385990 RepID=UPI003904C530